MAAQKKKHAEIIERIEYTRNFLGLNKSRFSAEIGMKPQTYNNFIGAQGSKPNVELIVGMLERFSVNPAWLLNGRGEMFLEEESPLDGTGGRFRVAESGAARGRGRGRNVEHVRRKLRNLRPLLKELETRLKQVELSQGPFFESLFNVLQGYMEIDAAVVVAEIEALTERLEERLDPR